MEEEEVRGWREGNDDIVQYYNRECSKIVWKRHSENYLTTLTTTIIT
jgi:hypothetical protein